MCMTRSLFLTYIYSGGNSTGILTVPHRVAREPAPKALCCLTPRSRVWNVNCSPLELCKHAALKGVSSHCSNVLRWPRAYDPRWPCFQWQNERKKKKTKKQRLCRLSKNSLEAAIVRSPLTRARDMRMPTPIWKESKELHPVFLQALGLSKERNGNKHRNKSESKLTLRGRKQRKEDFKTEKVCPILLRLSINIKAYRKLKLLCDIYKYTVNRNIYIFVYHFMSKNIKAFLIVW